MNGLVFPIGLEDKAFWGWVTALLLMEFISFLRLYDETCSSTTVLSSESFFQEYLKFSPRSNPTSASLLLVTMLRPTSFHPAIITAAAPVPTKNLPIKPTASNPHP